MYLNSHLQTVNHTILNLGKTVYLIIVLVQREINVKKQNWKETECSLYFLYMLSSAIWGPSDFSIQNRIPTIADYYCIYILVIRQLFYLLPVIFELSSWNYLKLSCLKIRCLTSLDHYTKSLKLWRFTKSSFHTPPPPLFEENLRLLSLGVMVEIVEKIIVIKQNSS